MGQSLVLPDLRSGRYPGFVLVVTIDGRVTAMSSDSHEERQMVLPGASGVDFVSHATMFREGVVVGGALGGRPFSLVPVYMPRREKDALICFFVAGRGGLSGKGVARRVVFEGAVFLEYHSWGEEGSGSVGFAFISRSGVHRPRIWLNREGLLPPFAEDHVGHYTEAFRLGLWFGAELAGGSSGVKVVALLDGEPFEGESGLGTSPP